MGTRRTVYQVCTLSGEVVAEHVRDDLADGSKRMAWRRPGLAPSEGLAGLRTADLPLYGSERLVSLPTGATVLACEGERATEACWRLGYAAVGTVTGASGTPGEDALAVLLEYDVVLWPDNDDPGREHMARVAAGLIRLGGSCRLLEWGRKKGDDAADFVVLHGADAVTPLGIFVRYAREYHPTVNETRPPVRVLHPRDAYDRVERARSELLDVVETRLGPPVKADRRSAWWHCPFHGLDRTPSFKVDLAAPFFRCFGCDAKGDVFSFVKRHDGLDFKDALLTLAPVPALGGIPRFAP